LILQRYVSDELTHFVGGSRPTLDCRRYELLIKILKERRLTRRLDWGSPFDLPQLAMMVNGEESISVNKKFDGHYVCFCDIPAVDLPLHMQKYGRFGLSFSKTFLTEQGATPVFYVARGAKSQLSPTRHQTNARVFDNGFAWLSSLLVKLEREPSEKTEIHRIYTFLYLHLFPFLKFFDHTREDYDRENYYMEREWRVIGHVTFQLSDIRRIIMPEEYARRFREAVPDYFGQITFAPIMEQL